MQQKARAAARRRATRLRPVLLLALPLQLLHLGQRLRRPGGRQALMQRQAACRPPLQAQHVSSAAAPAPFLALPLPGLSVRLHQGLAVYLQAPVE